MSRSILVGQLHSRLGVSKIAAGTYLRCLSAR